jgi:DNA-binding CsgD family transcriptional regulator
VTIVSARTARQFSAALGCLYASPSREMLDRATAEAIDALFPGRPHTERADWADWLCKPETLARDDGYPKNMPALLLLELLQPHVRRCQCRLAARPDHGTAPANIQHPPTGLTSREDEVLKRIALGETDAEIGRGLGISPKTVGKHVEHILHKFGVETRTGAVIYMHSPPDP